MLDFVNSFKPEILNFGIFVLMVVSVFLVGLLVNAVRRTEFFKQYQHIFDTLDNVILDNIILVSFGDYDAAVWIAEETRRAAEGLEAIDYRMLFVLDKAEKFLEQYGIEVELEPLLARAERLFQEYKADESTPEV